MSQGEIARSIETRVLFSIPAFVSAAESIFGKGNGKTKKNAVLEIIMGLLTIGGAGAAMNNPRYAGAIEKGIDTAAAVLFPHSAAAPDVSPQVPQPAAPVVSDPSAARYETLESAKALLSGSWDEVLEYMDQFGGGALYGVWASQFPQIPPNTIVVFPIRTLMDAAEPRQADPSNQAGTRDAKPPQEITDYYAAKESETQSDDSATGFGVGAKHPEFK